MNGRRKNEENKYRIKKERKRLPYMTKMKISVLRNC